MSVTTVNLPHPAAPHEGPALGDPRACRITCSYWSDLLGECTLPAEERTCGQRPSRAADERETPFHLFGRGPAAADAAAMAPHWRRIVFER